MYGLSPRRKKARRKEQRARSKRKRREADKLIDDAEALKEAQEERMLAALEPGAEEAFQARHAASMEAAVLPTPGRSLWQRCIRRLPGSKQRA